MDWELIKGFGVALAVWLIIGGFAFWVVKDYEQGKARCPGYYNINYGCAVPR